MLTTVRLTAIIITNMQTDLQKTLVVTITDMQLDLAVRKLAR